MRKPRGDYIPIPIGSHPRAFGTSWRFRRPNGECGIGISLRDLHDQYGVVHFVKGSHRP